MIYESFPLPLSPFLPCCGILRVWSYVSDTLHRVLFSLNSFRNCNNCSKMHWEIPTVFQVCYTTFQMRGKLYGRGLPRNFIFKLICSCDVTGMQDFTYWLYVILLPIDHFHKRSGVRYPLHSSTDADLSRSPMRFRTSVKTPHYSAKCTPDNSNSHVFIDRNVGSVIR